MFDIYSFDAPSRVSSNFSILQPGIAYVNRNLHISYVNAQGQLALQEQFEQEQVQSITKQKITAQILATIEGQPVIVCGIEDVNQQGHLMIYNQQQKRLIATYDVDQRVQKLLSCSNDIILAASGDLIHCYRVSLSRTAGGFKELFWADASMEITDLYILNLDSSGRTITFATLCSDNYLRVFVNEDFQSETRPFARIKYSKVEQFNCFFGILTETKKLKLYFYDIQQQKFRILVSQDVPPNYSSFCFIFKPYARQLQHISNQNEQEIERMLQLSAPIPFILLYNQKHSKVTLNFVDLVENKLVLKILLIQKVKIQNINIISKTISNSEQFETFMLQYIQNFELENPELPFTADDTKQNCKQLLSFVNVDSGCIYEFPIVFDFIELLQYVQDMDEEGSLQQLGLKLPRNKQEAEQKVGTEGEHVHKKKKRSKARKQQFEGELEDLQQVYALQALHDQLYQLVKAASATKSPDEDEQLGFSTGQLGLSVDKGSGLLMTSNPDVKLLNWAMHFDRETNINLIEQENRCRVSYGVFESNFEPKSDILMLHNARLSHTVDASTYGGLNYLQKERFHRGASGGARRDPLPLNNSQQQVECFASFSLAGRVFSRTFPLTVYVLPAYSMVSTESPSENDIHNSSNAKITLKNVHIDQLKVCYRLQALEAPAPTTLGGFRLACASVGIFGREFHQDNDQSTTEVACRWENDVLVISSANIRAALNYAMVFARAAGWSDQYTLSLGNTSEKRLSKLLGDVFSAADATGDLSALQAENTAALANISAQIAQKRFDTSFQQLDAIIRQQLTTLKTQFETQKVNEDVIFNVNELIQLLSWTSTGQKQLETHWRDFLKRNISSQEFVDKWRTIEG